MKFSPRLVFYYLGLIMLMIVLSIGAWWWKISQSIFNQALDTQTLIEFPTRSTAKDLTRILQSKQLLTHPKVFLFLIKWKDVGKYLKSGTYQIRPQDTLWDVVEKIMHGDVYKIPLKIIEGTRLCEIEQTLKSNQHIRFEPEILQNLNQKYPSLEGLLYPSTYQQPYGESVLPVLKLAHQTLLEKLQLVWAARDLDLPYENPYQLLIAASIIEKEASDDQERKIISGIIINRLRLHMPLQMDPTVAYAISGCKHTILKGSDLKVDTPYNSYLHKGLPPTPITTVSMSSLQAAAHPMRTPFLYFVAKGDGHHEFSVDYLSQQKAIRYFLRKTNG